MKTSFQLIYYNASQEEIYIRNFASLDLKEKYEYVFSNLWGENFWGDKPRFYSQEVEIRDEIPYDDVDDLIESFQEGHGH
jgi:hypothetical protein